MGEIAGELADFCILTSDNPRNEDPMDILDAIEEGIRPHRLRICRDRESPRGHQVCARRTRSPSDVVVLAGKGHETYQEIKGVQLSVR